jgi:hypothetical protein
MLPKESRIEEPNFNTGIATPKELPAPIQSKRPLLPTRDPAVRHLAANGQLPVSTIWNFGALIFR